jgi:hypothetical protein
MRVDEAVHLGVADIDSLRMIDEVRRGRLESTLAGLCSSIRGE